jgi:UrcA family protein
MITLYLALAASTAAPLDRQTDLASEQNVVRVDFGDLNLNSRAGQAKLRHRLDRAASRACDDGSGPKTLSMWRQVEMCREHARTEASREIERVTGTAVATNDREVPKL